MRPYFIDLHEDISSYYLTRGAELAFPVEDFELDTKARHADIPKYRRANVILVFASIFPGLYTLDPELSKRHAELYRSEMEPVATSLRSASALFMEHLRVYRTLIQMHSRDIFSVETNKDLGRPFEGRRTGFLLSLEGADSLADVGDLETFYRLGIRSVHLTWNFENRYSASCTSTKDYGLTGEGAALVKKANELGVILDMSHASRGAAREVLQMTRLPAIFSHANSDAVLQHPRNVDDETLDLLKRREGVIGFTLIASAIAEKATMKVLADHIMYVRERFGSEILAVGTDFFGIPAASEPQGLEDVTKFQNLWNLLLKRGMGKEEVEKISFRNALRVISRNAALWRQRS